MAAEEAPPQAEPKKKKGLPMNVIIIAGITVAQAAGFFFAFKMLGGGPAPTHGAEGENYIEGEGGHATTQPVQMVEVPLLEKFRVPNKKSGATFMYDFDVYVVVPADHKEKIELLKEERYGEIADRIAQIVRAADPAILNEDDLQTLRVQIQHVIGGIAEDEHLIQRVLIPRCVPIRMS
ncbi:MAG: hypothetical protein JNG88_13460 [Phycisphaerales bacterium]|nr:hypothetical protein [Phycisphaerales bacterium]